MKKTVLWISMAALLTAGCAQRTTTREIGSFEVLDNRFWDEVSRQAAAERIGINFQFTEGPVWHPEGYLLFSDIPANTIYRWTGKRYVEYLSPSGNSNGLMVDSQGRLVTCQHGTRTVTRYSGTGGPEVLADRFRGKRLNSPNDLCQDSRGAIYFTDPPWGLPGRNEDPAKELPFNGVYRLDDEGLALIDSTLSWPNGIALSPGEDYLYVANFEPAPGKGRRERDVFWVRYTLDERGRVTGKERFFTAPDPDLDGGPDGMKVSRNGTLFATGPGGILVIDSGGNHLGTITLPLPPANVAFGPREKELFATARTSVVRIRIR